MKYDFIKEKMLSKKREEEYGIWANIIAHLI